MLNTNKIKGRMVELGLKQKDVAKALGIATPSISQKLNGKRPMYLEEARQLAELLKIEKGAFGSYFFYNAICATQSNDLIR